MTLMVCVCVCVFTNLQIESGSVSPVSDSHKSSIMHKSLAAQCGTGSLVCC
jgi:hypothetical protein